MKFKLRAQSLRARLMLSIGSSLLLGLALLCGVVNWEASKIVEKETVERAQVEADAIGAHIAQSFNLLSHGVDQLAADILTARKLGRDNRAQVVEQLRDLCDRMPSALGFWICMEPDIFGGKDEEAKGTEGSNPAGLFAPYWTRASGNLSLETSEDFSDKEYYALPKKNKTPLFLDPYLDTAGGQSVMMTSYTVPLFDGDRFLGVVGVDLSLSSLDKLTMGNAFVQRLGGYASVISSNGITAAHPSKDYLGKVFATQSVWAKAFESDMKEGKPWILLNTSSSKKEKVYRIGVPMELGAKIKPWTVIVTLPRSAMLTAVADMRNLIIALGCAGFVLVLGLIVGVTHRITKPISSLSQGLLDGAAQISSAAAQVSNSGQSLAQTASQQAAALEESSASLEELSSMTKANTQNASQATQLAREAREATDHGLEQMKSMQAAMGAIKSSSDEIAKIIKTIDEIAFQTNILALNAAVEAARAGEAGAGFAVVAEEVRNLAQRSAHAARETSEKIEGAISKTQQGVRMSEEVATSLSSIATRIHSVDDLVAQVAGAAGEQTRGIGQINSAVTDLDRITQTNAATAEESASAAQELNAQAEVFRKLIGDLDRVIRG